MANIPINAREVGKVFSNFPAILEKTERDGSLQLLATTARQILIKERTFAKNGNINRTTETSKRGKRVFNRRTAPNESVCF